MLTLRRRFASCALALLCFQTAAVFAAPLASCCATSAVSADDEKDCCPPGSHPPGQCPRRAASKPGARPACHVQCDAPHGVQFLIGALGVLPSPAVSLASAVPSAHPRPAAALPGARASIPDPPPPRID